MENEESRKDIPKTPYYEAEFEVFLKEIGNANLSNWTIMAEVLNVHPETIRRWKDHPLAKEAINAAIEKSIKRMEEVGDTDWKMHREKLKMLGVKDKTTVEHEGELGLRVKSNDEIAKKLQEVIIDDKPEENTSGTPDNQ